MINFLKNLFGKETRIEISSCYMCNTKIYEGDVYGHDNEPGNLLLGGYYFCPVCIGRQNIDRINESVVGQVYMLSDGKQRYRVTIKK